MRIGWLVLVVGCTGGPEPESCAEPHVYYAPDASGDLYFGCSPPVGWGSTPPDEPAPTDPQTARVAASPPPPGPPNPPALEPPPDTGATGDTGLEPEADAPPEDVAPEDVAPEDVALEEQGGTADTGTEDSAEDTGLVEGEGLEGDEGDVGEPVDSADPAAEDDGEPPPDTQDTGTP